MADDGKNGATTPRGSRASCAQCGVSLEWASLLLACEHHLCLACSAHALHREPNGPVVQCSVCEAVTSVDETAAKYLEGLKPAQTRTGSGHEPLPSPTGSVAPSQPSPPITNQTRARSVSPSPAAQDRVPGGAKPSAEPTLLPQPRPLESGRGNNASSSCASGLSAPLTVTKPVAEPRSAVTQPSPPPPSTAHMTAPSLVGLSAQRSSNSKSTSTTCGQCEAKSADVFCEQCGEYFCHACSRALHRRGALAQHRLKQLGETSSERGASPRQEPSQSAAPTPPVSGASSPRLDIRSGAELPSHWRVPATAALVPLPRRFHRCPTHPEEPLQFFCLTCEMDCICAECALHGDHRGHDVLNVRDAASRLPERLAQLGSRTMTRVEELAAIIENAKDGHRELANIASQGRRDLRAAFERLRVALQEEETALLAEVDRCTADVAEILTIEDPPSEAHARDCHASLRRHHRNGQSTDHVQALNWYSKAKKAHAEQPPQRPDIGAELHNQLRGQLQRGFEARLAGVATVQQKVGELTVVQLKGVDHELSKMWPHGEIPLRTSADSSIGGGGVVGASSTVSTSVPGSPEQASWPGLGGRREADTRGIFKDDAASGSLRNSLPGRQAGAKLASWGGHPGDGDVLGAEKGFGHVEKRAGISTPSRISGAGFGGSSGLQSPDNFSDGAQFALRGQ